MPIIHYVYGPEDAFVDVFANNRALYIEKNRFSRVATRKKKKNKDTNEMILCTLAKASAQQQLDRKPSLPRETRAMRERDLYNIKGKTRE